MAPSVVLYSYFRSSASQRLRIILNYKKIQHSKKFINLAKFEQHSPEFEIVNGHKRLPVLSVDGKLMTQSVALAEFIEESFPDLPMLPKNPYDRHKVREVVNVIAYDIHGLQNQSTLLAIHDIYYRLESTEEADKQKLLWANNVITKGLVSVENLLQSSAGKYSFGDTVTFADAFLAPQVKTAMRWNVDLSKFPTIERVYTNLLEIEAFRDALPENQEDFVSA